ncbi:hypothetical protein [Vibrio rotiferianus]
MVVLIFFADHIARNIPLSIAYGRPEIALMCYSLPSSSLPFAGFQFR